MRESTEGASAGNTGGDEAQKQKCHIELFLGGEQEAAVFLESIAALRGVSEHKSHRSGKRVSFEISEDTISKLMKSVHSVLSTGGFIARAVQEVKGLMAEGTGGGCKEGSC